VPFSMGCVVQTNYRVVPAPVDRVLMLPVLPRLQRHDTEVQSVTSIAQNPLHTFPRNFPVHGRGSCRLVADLFAASRCNGIRETTRHNRHNGLLPAPTCYGLVGDLSFMLQTCYRLVVDLLRGNWCNGFCRPYTRFTR